MKILNKRVLAYLTSLLMLVSIFSSVVVLPAEAAVVDYVYSGNYVYNWGTREQVATFMSPMAEAWYSKNGTDYEELSGLQGGNGTSGVTSSALYNELQDLMVSNHKVITDYGDTKNLFKYTDCQNSGGKISSFYSGKAIGPNWDGGWNREHTWPNSKGSGNGENDIMMLRPTSTSENSGRGNKAYGQSSGYYNPNAESGGKHDLRGDVARIMLYQHVRWSQSSLWGASGVMESLTVLLNWVTEDPVDTWELGRNDAVQSITGTRNVFVDYPELVFLMFGTDIPDDYQSPSGEGAQSAYAITATVNNSAYGSVMVNGRNITASPKSGYAVSGYTILSGSAQVVQKGNVFTVTATEDVSIRIDFAPRYQTVVGFLDGDGMYDTLFPFVGDEITMPAYTDEMNEGWSFVGWVESEMEETTDLPTYYPIGSKYVVSDEEGHTFYALFSRTDMNGTELSNVFEPYSGPLTEGDYLIVYDGKAMVGTVTDKTRLDVVDVTLQNGNILLPAANAVWHIAQSGSQWTIQNVDGGKYAAGTTVKSSNQATLIADLTDLAKWTVEVKSTGYEFTNVGREALSANPLLRYNKSVSAFACYAKNTNVGGPNLLYKRAGGTTYYFTDNSCWHEYFAKPGQMPPCGSDETREVTFECILCGDTYVEEMAADPEHWHSVGEGEYPTCGGEAVVITCACDICGVSIEWEIVPYSEHEYDGEEDEDCYYCGALRNEKPDVIPGDLNGDGKVNNRDLAVLQKYLNEWEVTVVEAALDVNGDGKVNNRDQGALQVILNN